MSSSRESSWPRDSLLLGRQILYPWATGEAHGFVIHGLNYVEVGSLYAHFLESFYHKWAGCWVGPSPSVKKVTSGRVHAGEHSLGPLGQCLCPFCEPQLTSTSLGDPPRHIGRSGPGFYEVTALPWVPVNKKPCAPSKSGVPVSLSPGELLHSNPASFETQMLLGLLLSNTISPGWGAWWAAQNSHSCEKIPVI